jgi:N6-L-threonylcarbamoyladenine synthase
MPVKLSPLILAIETSCDETAVAILSGKGELLASEVASQIAIHRPFGGVVPEVASRNHLTAIRPLIDVAMKTANCSTTQIDAFAATLGPGLATSLMIGAAAAKGLAIGSGKPFFAINHIEGHLLSPFFGVEVQPCVALVVSGGHTILVDVEAHGKYQLLGQTHDDAAGEAFDKVGKLLKLPYPGGPQIDLLARVGNPARFDFPRSMINSGDFHFSFSGLKTAVRYMLPKFQPEDLADVCASFQEAVVDVLIRKTIAAARANRRNLVTVSGGVSCNSRLREKFRTECEGEGIRLLIADSKLCTDNAAMIAFVAAQKLAAGSESSLQEDINPNLRLV